MDFGYDKIKKKKEKERRERENEMKNKSVKCVVHGLHEHDANNTIAMPRFIRIILFFFNIIIIINIFFYTSNFTHLLFIYVC